MARHVKDIPPQHSIPLYYDDGTLRWKKNNKEAGTMHRDGYTQIQINGRFYLAHHLVWFLVKGEWPTGFIKHRNGLKYDNRIDNLELRG